jgi:hypothetical protein
MQCDKSKGKKNNDSDNYKGIYCMSEVSLVFWGGDILPRREKVGGVVRS